jgi:hypothetical protein
MADEEDDDEERYVHRPSGEPPRQAPPGDQEFGWRGWVVVGALIVSFLVVPGAIVLLPPAQESVAAFGLSLRDTYLVVPLVPALVLGALGVWTALRARQS